MEMKVIIIRTIKNFFFDKAGFRIAIETNASEDLEVLKQIQINIIRKLGFNEHIFASNEIRVKDVIFTIPEGYDLKEKVSSYKGYTFTSYTNGENTIYLSLDSDSPDYSDHDLEVMIINGNKGFYYKDNKEFYFERDGIRIAIETNASEDLEVLKQIQITKIMKCELCEKVLFEGEQFCTNCGERIYVINEAGDVLPPDKEIEIEDFVFTIPGDYYLKEPISVNGTYYSTSFSNGKNRINLSINTNITEDFSYEDEAMTMNGNEGYYSTDTKEFYFDLDGVRIYLETDADNDIEVLNQIQIFKINLCENCGERLFGDENVCPICGEKLE